MSASASGDFHTSRADRLFAVDTPMLRVWFVMAVRQGIENLLHYISFVGDFTVFGHLIQQICLLRRWLFTSPAPMLLGCLEPED
ncbi:hypothetical protein R1flu_007461 [Riccia fluitans]|uniref:Uncharacterized protein n=1 Tax=Riccia fluitans TaxID=41844 RepID=A0ABD1Z1Y6_9MARC